jgi:FkbM family methyltransferase
MLRDLSRFLLRFLPEHTIVPILNGPLRGVHSGVHTYWRGVYEPELTKHIQSVVKSGMTCYDCGANVGYFTLLFSKLVGPSGRVFSFEPLPVNGDHLRRHISVNRRGNVTVIQSALADYNGRVHLSSEGAASKIGPQGEVEVDCRTIDSLGLPPPDVMKIDVEGAEVLLLNGAENTIRTHRPIVFMSLHVPIPTAHDLAGRLESMGYKVTFSESSYDLSAFPSK